MGPTKKKPWEIENMWADGVVVTRLVDISIRRSLVQTQVGPLFSFATFKNFLFITTYSLAVGMNIFFWCKFVFDDLFSARDTIKRKIMQLRNQERVCSRG